VLSYGVLISALLLSLVLQAPAATASAPAVARVWDGRAAEYEEFLRTAPIERIEAIPLGVTKPRRAYFAPGGLAESAAFKPLRPSYQGGWFESYKSEIAAYELDKLLGLGMVPPTVERTYLRDTGALVLWLKGVRSWEQANADPNKPPSWSRQLVRMKLFDDLIGNPDNNKGNMLVDGAWNLYLIDHSRSFMEDRNMLPQKLDHVETALWDKIMALDEPALKSTLGAWLNEKQIKAMLARRDRMKAMVDDLVAKNGKRAVFVW
jgi:hypothetical protein